MKTIQIKTPMNVNVEAKFASPGLRIVAFLIDLFVVFLYLRGVFFLFDDILKHNIFDYEGSYYDISVFYDTLFTLALFPAFFYSLWSEMVFNGQTVGKMVVGTRVVKINGYRAKFTEYFTRWAFRLIDFWTGLFLVLFLIPLVGELNAMIIGYLLLIVSGLVAFIFIVRTENSQRLGDVVAGTTVLKLKEKHSIDITILEELSEDYVPQYTQVMLLSDNDARIIKDTFMVAKKNRDYATMRRLKKRLEQVMNVESDERAEDFINTVMKDFNYYTQKL